MTKLSDSQVSDYTRHLGTSEMTWYRQQLSDTWIRDSYLALVIVFQPLAPAMDRKNVPNLEYPDLINYLVLNHLPIVASQ